MIPVRPQRQPNRVMSGPAGHSINRNEPVSKSRRHNDIIEDPKEDLMDDEFASDQKDVDSIGEQSEEEVKHIEDETFGVYISA